MTSPAHVTGPRAALITEMFAGRRGRLRDYAFELATGIAYPILGFAYFTNPSYVALHSVIAHRVFPFDYMWSVGYIAGGLLILIGIAAARFRVRTVGLVILGTALAMQTAAAVVTQPDIREAFNLIYAFACFTRVHVVVRLFQRYSPVAGGDADAG